MLKIVLVAQIHEQMKYIRLGSITLLLILVQQVITYGQRSFEVPDSLIFHLYDVLSGPAGDRNWELYKSLFHEKAILGAVSTDANGHQTYRCSTPAEYMKRNGEFYRANGFYVAETHRVTERFGDIIQLFSTYQYRVDGGGGVEGKQSGRGINSFQLVRDANRWWIISIQFTNERPDLPIPRLYGG
jgi:hypothetical protein